MMRNQSMLVWIYAMVMVLAMTTWVGAEIPQIIAYQGILSDAEGNTLDGSYDITARLYTAASGTTAIWSEIHSGVGVAKGVFAIMLGQSSSLTTVNFDQRLWLGVSVGQGAELSPRTELASVASAFLAQTVVDGAITEPKIAEGQIVKSINGATDHLNIVGLKDIYVHRDEDTIKIYLKECDGSGWGPWSASCATWWGTSTCVPPTHVKCCSTGPRTRHRCENGLITDTQTEQICLSAAQMSTCP